MTTAAACPIACAHVLLRQGDLLELAAADALLPLPLPTCGRVASVAAVEPAPTLQPLSR